VVLVLVVVVGRLVLVVRVLAWLVVLMSRVLLVLMRCGVIRGVDT
jgi:hypothetical protein